MQIKHMTKLAKPGKIRAFFSVEIPNQMIIRDCKLIQNDDGNFFAGFPSRKYTDKEGKEKWTNIIEILDPNLKARIGDMALEKYQGTIDKSDDQPPF